jgi:hypothetical protein
MGDELTDVHEPTPSVKPKFLLKKVLIYKLIIHKGLPLQDDTDAPGLSEVQLFPLPGLVIHLLKYTPFHRECSDRESGTDRE